MTIQGKVAVITGSGNGLGREYALYLAKHGAKIIVNDIGISKNGIRPADAVVTEIERMGGLAVADYNSVVNGDKIIDTAIRNFGRIDILINNAGIIRDFSFKNMSEKDWDLVMNVHVKGAFMCTKAAWPYMQKQKFGRIVNTASASGLYGNFGQTNYATAKMALVGMTVSLSKEGEKYNIHINCIAPIAGTQMSSNLLPKEVNEKLKPQHIPPLVAALSSEESPQNGKVFEVGGGVVSAVRLQRSKGHVFPKNFTHEDIFKEQNSINDFAKSSYPNSLQESILAFMERIQDNESQASDEDGDAASGHKITKSEQLFDSLKIYLKTPEAKKMAERVNCVYRMDIKPSKSESPVTFTFDLRPGNVKIERKVPEKEDAMFTLLDEDFINIVNRKLNPQVAFLNGKMKIKGNMKAAMKFTPDLFPHPSKL